MRDEILDATTELLLETGQAKAVSIRSVAQRVGVTPPSIYLHFADKDALLDAVCARYFEKLDKEMQRVAADQTSTIDVLRARNPHGTVIERDTSPLPAASSAVAEAAPPRGSAAGSVQAVVARSSPAVV